MRALVKISAVLLLLAAALAARAQVVGLEPTPQAYYYWDPGTNGWVACSNTSSSQPSANLPQAFAAYGRNASLGQWTPLPGPASCPGNSSIGNLIPESTNFNPSCSLSQGFAAMASITATLPPYATACLIPFSAVNPGTVLTIDSGTTNILDECTGTLVSSVPLSAPQTLRIWSNGTNWEASCPSGASAAQPINVKTQGLVCDGTTDDTVKWNSMVTAVNAANVPVSIYIPAGSKCYIPGVRTAITVPAEVYGNGPCADVASTGCISAVLYDSTNGDGVNITGFSASVHDLGFIDTNASTPTQGAAVDFCPASAAENAIFHVQHSSFQGSYVGIKSCQSEGSTITNNYFSEIVYDAILMDGQTPYNGGDFVISGNTGNASGSPANAFIDLEGQNAGRIIGNKSVQGGGGNYNYSVYCGTIAGGPGCFNVVINSNDFENAQIETLYLDESGAFPNTFMTISGNQFLYQATTGPLVTINSANGVYFGGNTVSNGNNTASPEVVLFTGISESSDVEPQSGAIGPSSTGSISSSSNQLTVSYPAAFTVGDGIIVQGAGAAGAPLSATVSSITGSVLTLSVNASTSVTNEPVNGRNSFVTTQSGLSAVNAGFPYFNTDNSSPASYGGSATFASVNGVPTQSLYIGTPSTATGIFMQPAGVNTALFAANTFRPVLDNTMTDGQAGYAFTGTYTYQACFATSTSISSCLAASGLTADRTWAWPDLSGTVGVIPTASTGHAICETTAHALGHCSSVVASDGTCTCN